MDLAIQLQSTVKRANFWQALFQYSPLSIFEKFARNQITKVNLSLNRYQPAFNQLDVADLIELRNVLRICYGLFQLNHASFDLEKELRELSAHLQHIERLVHDSYRLNIAEDELVSTALESLARAYGDNEPEYSIDDLIDSPRKPRNERR